MRLLLDTHTFLWFLLDDPQLSTTANELLVDPNNGIEVSPATYWEIAIKISLGKYELPEPYLVTCTHCLPKGEGPYIFLTPWLLHRDNGGRFRETEQRGDRK